MYLVQWGDSKEKAWSGTNWHLYKALQNYLELVDIDIPITPTPSFFQQLFNLKSDQPDVGLRVTKQGGKYAKTFLPKRDNITLLQFAENVFNKKDVRTYIYQDLSVSYLKFIVENDPQLFSFSGFQDNPYSAILKRAKYQDAYYSTCSGIFTMGKWLAKDMIERCHIKSSKVHAVGGGINIDSSLIDYSKKKGSKILFVGRDFVRKGGYLVVDAFKKIRKKSKNVELYVAGPIVNPINEDLDGYHFLGDCNYKETAEIFNLCDVYCMPSYFEAYGLVFIEALTFGLPVIGRNSFEMPYFIDEGETGMLLHEDNVDVLSDMIEDLLVNNDVKRNVRERRDYFLSQYSWDGVAKRICSVIEEDYPSK